MLRFLVALFLSAAVLVARGPFYVVLWFCLVHVVGGEGAAGIAKAFTDAGTV